MIKLIPIYKNYVALEAIAFWRNETLHTLRTTEPTTTGQENWIDSLDLCGTDRFYFIKYGDKIVGYCGLSSISEINKTAEINLLISKNYRHKGIGSKTTQELFKIAFDHLNLNCVYAECYTTENTWKFWENCGFKKEGELLARKFYKGKFYNLIVGSKIRGD